MKSSYFSVLFLLFGILVFYSKSNTSVEHIESLAELEQREECICHPDPCYMCDFYNEDSGGNYWKDPADDSGIGKIKFKVPSDPCNGSPNPCCGIDCGYGYICQNGECIEDPSLEPCPFQPCPSGYKCGIIGGQKGCVLDPDN